MSQFDRRCSPRLPVSLLVRLDLNGTEVDATARDISRGGAFIICKTFLAVGDNQRIRVEVLTGAGTFQMHGIVLGPRAAWPATQSARRPSRFGFAIQFDPLEFILERIFASILEGLSVEAVSISLRIQGLGRVEGTVAEPAPTNRRARARVNIAVPMLVGTLRESVKAAQSTLVNLSATGACFEIRGDHHGFVDRLTLQILLPHLFQQEMSNPKTELGPVTAQIVWIKPVTPVGDAAPDSAAGMQVGVRFLYYDAKSQRPIARVVGQLLLASDQFDQSRAGGMIATEAVEFRNERGQRIAGYLHNPKRALPGSPIAIISPGYGESKRAYVTLGFYLAENGFHVLRYDHCNHIGESDGDSTKTTLTGFQRDLQAALTFAKQTSPNSLIAVIASGLAGRVSLKTAGDRRIDLLLILSGILDLQRACAATHQEDVIVSFLRGTRRGVSHLMGLEIDTDAFLEDAIKESYADLRTTLRDAQQIQVPVLFFATPEEAAEPLSAVNEVRGAISREELCHVFPIPQALEQLHESPRKEWAMFRQLVSCCLAQFSPAAGERKLVEPSQVEIGRQNRLERQRARTNQPTDPSGGKNPRHAYLDHFHCLSNIPEYWQLLDQIVRHVGMMEKESTILEAGCGPGNLGICLLLDDLYRRRGASRIASSGLRYVGIEVMHSAVTLAHRHFSNLRQDSVFMEANHAEASKIQTSLTRADLSRPLPFRDHQFDRVICNLVLGYLEDPMSSLQELIRVLAPGGKIIVTSLKPEADLIEIYRSFRLRTDLPEEVEEAEHLLNTACKIKQAENDGIFRSFHPHELAMLLLMSGAAEPRISSTFGEQAYIVVAEKQSHHEHEEGLPQHRLHDGDPDPDVAMVSTP
jgi:SAM-dependent methyltransferase